MHHSVHLMLMVVCACESRVNNRGSAGLSCMNASRFEEDPFHSLHSPFRSRDVELDGLDYREKQGVGPDTIPGLTTTTVPRAMIMKDDPW